MLKKLAIAAVAVVAALLVSLWIGHHAGVTLPAPTGPFPVSRTLEVWRDAHHELVVWTWYPTAASPDAKRAEYLPPDWRRATRGGGVMSTLLWRDLSHVHPHSVDGGPLSATRPRYPVVILRAGGGALTTQFTTLAEEMASHGYVVMGFDAPYRTGTVVFPDGRVVHRPESLNPETMPADAAERLAEKLLAAWVSDIGFAVDRLATSRLGARLDLQKIAVVGHSLGGASALQFCHDDPRCTAAADLDGRLFGSVVRDGLRRPVLFVLSDHGQALDPLDRRILGEIQSVYDRLPPDSRRKLTIKGANHFTFSDQWLVANPVLVRILRTLRVLKVDPRDGLAVAGDAVCRFLAKVNA